MNPAINPAMNPAMNPPVLVDHVPPSTGHPLGWLALAVVVVLVATAWYWGNRVDRLHRKVDALSANLVRHLTSRATATLDLAYSGRLDPASSLILADVSRRCLTQAAGAAPLSAEAAIANSELTHTVSLALGSTDDVFDLGPGALDLLQPMADAWLRAFNARTFYNEAVDHTRRLRSILAVRMLRLAGRAPMPTTFDIDDTWPPALPRPGVTVG